MVQPTLGYNQYAYGISLPLPRVRLYGRARLATSRSFLSACHAPVLLLQYDCQCVW